MEVAPVSSEVVPNSEMLLPLDVEMALDFEMVPDAEMVSDSLLPDLEMAPIRCGRPLSHALTAISSMRTENHRTTRTRRCGTLENLFKYLCIFYWFMLSLVHTSSMSIFYLRGMLHISSNQYSVSYIQLYLFFDYQGQRNEICKLYFTLLLQTLNCMNV